MIQKITIAICDDDLILGNIVKEKCLEFFCDKQCSCEISLFENSVELLAKQEKYDLYFLDVEMPFMSGFHVAERINEQQKGATLIILTSHDEMIKQGYKVNAFRYLTKPIEVEEFCEALTSFLSKREKNQKFLVETGKQSFIVNEEEIFYVEALGDSVSIFIGNQSIIIQENLKQWNQKLDTHSFFQVSRSHIVHFKFVEEVDKKRLLLKNGKQLPISRRRRGEFQEAYNDFIFQTAIFFGGK